MDCAGPQAELRGARPVQSAFETQQRVRRATHGVHSSPTNSLPYSYLVCGAGLANLAANAAWQEATMLERKLLIALITAIGSMNAAACGGQAARSAPTAHARTGASAAGSSMKASETSFASDSPHHFRKDASREAFLSTYNNPEEGISLRYPRNYSLEEGDLEEHSFFLKRQEDLDSEQPGAILVATILIPEDGYPNTTFEHGSLQLVVNEGGTEQSCRDTNLIGSGTITRRSALFQAIVLWGNEEQSETAGSKIWERAYAGYSQRTCYEFFLTVVAEEAFDLDGFKKPADTNKIMKQLEKIVSSTQIFTKSAPPTTDGEQSADRL